MTALKDFLSDLARGMNAARVGDCGDSNLIAQLLATGDAAAFEAIVRRHGAMVYRVCWRILRHSQDCEDAFQATFLILAQKLRSLRKRNSLASWLHGIAHRVSLKVKSQAAARRRR